jgi:hypothetical protein
MLIDPWIQTYSILRVFYQTSRSDGRDLLRDLSKLAAMLVVGILISFSAARAEQPRVSKKDALQSLNQGIDRVSKDIDYGWLRPKEAEPNSGFVADLARRIDAIYNSVTAQVEHWYRELTHWLRDVFGQREDKNDKDLEKAAPRSQELRWTLGILAVLICGAVIAIFLRGRQLRKSVKAQSGSVKTAAPDVFNEELLASDVNDEEWLKLAAEYLGNNQTRLAARAFYLANLSHLGSQNLLALTLWKSNRIYERELGRQPKSGNLSPAFVTCNRLYECAWYGMRELANDQVDALTLAVSELRQHA